MKKREFVLVKHPWQTDGCLYIGTVVDEKIPTIDVEIPKDHWDYSDRTSPLWKNMCYSIIGVRSLSGITSEQMYTLRGILGYE